MLSWQERDSFREQYDAFFVGLLEEILQLIDEVELRKFSACEAGNMAKTRFCQLMWERLPECHQRVIGYKERVRAEQQKRGEEAAGYEESRQRAMRAETVRIEQEAADRQAEHHALGLKAERDQAEATRQSLEQDARERAKKEQQEQEAERQRVEKADELLRSKEQKEVATGK